MAPRAEQTPAPAGQAAADAALADACAELDVARREAEAGVERILATVEALLALEGDGDERLHGGVRTHAIAILEACGFQDITGQRLAKVARLLEGLQVQAPQAQGADDQRRRALHLNGPGLAGPEVSQAAINALFD
jgi:chemotaxis protein CheZ